MDGGSAYTDVHLVLLVGVHGVRCVSGYSSRQICVQRESFVFLKISDLWPRMSIVGFMEASKSSDGFLCSRGSCGVKVTGLDVTF